MAGFLYYLPNRDQSIKIADLRAAGLGYAFDEMFTPRVCMRGPDGNAGVVVAATDYRLGYYPDKQDWRQIPGSDAWVGMYRDERPVPADLARRELLDGVWVALEDGNRWLVPKARRWVQDGEQMRPSCGLPQLLSRDVSGQWWLGQVKTRYRQLWQLICEYEQAAGAAAAAGEEQFMFAVDDLAIIALQANYRVSAIEMCEMLEAYSQQERRTIIEALLDAATIEAWVKKKQIETGQAGGSSSSGPAPQTPAGEAGTVQQSPNCKPTRPDSTTNSVS